MFSLIAYYGFLIIILLNLIHNNFIVLNGIFLATLVMVTKPTLDILYFQQTFCFSV